MSFQFRSWPRRLIRSSSRLLKKTLPDLFRRGGAIHSRQQYPQTIAALRMATKSVLHDPTCQPWPLYRLRLFRWVRLTARIDSHSIELRLEPGTWPGRLVLKLFSRACHRWLKILHAHLYRTAWTGKTTTGRPRTGRLFLLLRLLCRFPYLPIKGLQLSTVFMMAVESRQQARPPFHFRGAGWLVAARLYASVQKGRLPLQSVYWHLLPVQLMHEDGRHLHGYLISELHAPPTKRTSSGPYFVVPQGSARLVLQPGRYGTGGADFPFRNTEAPTYLFYERRDGLIDCYQVDCHYPINHLQRFSVRAIQHSKRRRWFKTEPEEIIPPHLSLYVSRMDLYVKGCERLRQKDCLWRPDTATPGSLQQILDCAPSPKRSSVP